MQFISKKNSINNLYANANQIASNHVGVNYASGAGKVSDAFSGIDDTLGLLTPGATEFLTASATLTTDDFGKTLIVDTSGAGAALSFTLPDPTAILDQRLTFNSALTNIYTVTLTTPAGVFNNFGSSIVLNPGDSLQIQTLSTIGYAILYFNSSDACSSFKIIRLSTSDILSLGSSPFPAIVAPGLDRIILFQGMGSTWRVNFNTTAFAAGAAVQIRLGTNVVGALGVVGNATVSATSIMCGLPITNTQIQTQSAFVNQALNIGTAGNVNFTTGNGSFDFFLRYSIVYVG